MIRLSRLSGKEFYLNCELIKYVEATPDTLITLTTGEKVMVRERLAEVVDATRAFKRSVFRAGPAPGQDPQPPARQEKAGA